MRLAATLLALLPSVAVAEALALPANAVLTLEQAENPARYALPVGPWSDGAVPAETFEGPMLQQAWEVRGAGLTTLQILQPLRAQLREQGFDVLLDCDTEDCGGFDFRFATGVLPAPDMQVNLGDFRFLSARKADEAVSLLVSRTAGAGWVQVTYAGDVPAAAADPAPAIVAQVAASNLPLEASLDATGRAVLNGVRFATGSTDLAAGGEAALQALAAYLARFPDRRVALVGHTDSQGSLDGNIAISKRRAQSVLDRLVSDYGVPRDQMAAEGMGYLSPVASNLTDEGRAANRRVEVIITSTQ